MKPAFSAPFKFDDSTSFFSQDGIGLASTPLSQLPVPTTPKGLDINSPDRQIDIESMFVSVKNEQTTPLTNAKRKPGSILLNKKVKQTLEKHRELLMRSPEHNQNGDIQSAKGAKQPTKKQKLNKKPMIPPIPLNTPMRFGPSEVLCSKRTPTNPGISKKKIKSVEDKRSQSTTVAKTSSKKKQKDISKKPTATERTSELNINLMVESYARESFGKADNNKLKKKETIGDFVINLGQKQGIVFVIIYNVQK